MKATLFFPAPGPSVVRRSTRTPNVSKKEKKIITFFPVAASFICCQKRRRLLIRRPPSSRDCRHVRARCRHSHLDRGLMMKLIFSPGTENQEKRTVHARRPSTQTGAKYCLLHARRRRRHKRLFISFCSRLRLVVFLQTDVPIRAVAQQHARARRA